MNPPTRESGLPRQSVHALPSPASGPRPAKQTVNLSAASLPCNRSRCFAVGSFERLRSHRSLLPALASRLTCPCLSVTTTISKVMPAACLRLIFDCGHKRQTPPICRSSTAAVFFQLGTSPAKLAAPMPTPSSPLFGSPLAPTRDQFLGQSKFTCSCSRGMERDGYFWKAPALSRSRSWRSVKTGVTRHGQAAAASRPAESEREVDDAFRRY